MEKDLSRNVVFVLASLSYNLQRHGNDDHARYGVFGSIEIRNMAKILGDVTKPEAHRHLICFVMNVAVWYNAFASEKKKSQPLPGKLLKSPYQKTKTTEVYSYNQRLR